MGVILGGGSGCAVAPFIFKITPIDLRNTIYAIKKVIIITFYFKMLIIC